jgi:hypothetical protein
MNQNISYTSAYTWCDTKDWLKESWVHCLQMTGKGLKRTDIGLLLLRYTYFSSTKTKYFIGSAYSSLSYPLFNADSISRFLCLFCLYSSNRAFRTEWWATSKSCTRVSTLSWQASWLENSDQKVHWLFSCSFSAVLQLYIEKYLSWKLWS